MEWKDIVKACETVWNGGARKIFLGILLLVGCLIVAKIILKIFKNVLHKTKIDRAIQSFFRSILKFVLGIVIIYIVAAYFGISLTGFVVVISAASLALSLALQGSLSNLANGVVIIMTQPFKEGDFVKIGGNEGSVFRIRMLTTTIKTPDNKLIAVPNSNIISNEIVNYNALGVRKIVASFDVAYNTDIDKAKEIIMNVMHSNGNVKLDPSPEVFFVAMKESSLELSARCWVDCADYWSVYFYLQDGIFNEFKKNNISIPFNQLEVRMITDDSQLPYRHESLPERVEKAVDVHEKHNFLTTNLIPSFINKKKQDSKKNKEIKK